MQRGWFVAGKNTTPQQLYKSIPMINPKMHIIPGLPIPAVGRFPIVQAISEGWPEINDETWYTMAMTIAATNPQVFPKVYALCNKKLGTNPAGPAEHAAMYIHSPVQQAPWPAGPYNNRGNPPPPPPRPS